MARRHVEEVWASGGDTGTAPNTTAQATGWTATEPPFQLFNWLQNLITEFLEHVEQNGVSVWDAATTYSAGAIAIDSADGLLYRSLVGSNTGNQPSAEATGAPYAGSNWERLVKPAGVLNTGVIEIATQGEVNAGVDSSRAVTPLTLESKIANETNAGVLRVATSAEAQALANDARAITPAKLGALIATGAQLGLVRLATNAEVLTGTNSTKAVTALSLTQGNSIGATGYYRLPGGFIFQWGTANLPSSPTDVTLPLTFPNNAWGAVLGGPRLAQGTWDSGVEIIDTSTIRIGTAHLNEDIYWWAWGN